MNTSIHIMEVLFVRLEKEIREQYLRVVLKGNKEGLKVHQILVQFDLRVNLASNWEINVDLGCERVR